jgi:WD40 repeat protein
MLFATIVTAFGYAEFADPIHQAVSGIEQISSSDETPATVSVNRLSWSADGRKLLALRFGDFGPVGPLVLYNVDHKSELLPIDTGDEPVTDVALAPDGRHVLLGTIRGKLWWTSVDSDQRVLLLDLQPRKVISSVAITRDGHRVAAVDGDGNVYLLDLERQASCMFPDSLGAAGASLRFSPDGDQLIGAGSNGSVGIWEIPSGRLAFCATGIQIPMVAASFIARNDRVLSASFNEAIHVWDSRTGGEVSRQDLRQSSVLCIDVTRDGRTGARGGADRRVVIWDVDTGLEKLKLETTIATIRRVAFSPDEQYLAVSGRDTAIHIFETRTGALHLKLELGTQQTL